MKCKSERLSYKVVNDSIGLLGSLLTVGFDALRDARSTGKVFLTQNMEVLSVLKGPAYWKCITKAHNVVQK